MNDKRFLLKNDEWRLDVTNHQLIKQWFVRWTDSIHDYIVITNTNENCIGTHYIVKYQVCDNDGDINIKHEIVVSTLPSLMSQNIFNSSIGFVKTRYETSSGIYVDEFNNSQRTTIAIRDINNTTIPKWFGKEVTDHSFYKNDYLISIR